MGILIKSHLMNKKNMTQSCRVSVATLGKQGVTPVKCKSREAFYDVTSVTDNRVSDTISQITDDRGEIDDDELLRARIRLSTTQARARGFKDKRERGDVIDTVFYMYVLSKLASQISSVMDNLPLVITRKLPGMKPSTLDGLKKEVIRTYDVYAKLDENVPLMLSDYLMETAGSVPDKLQSDEDR